MMYPSAQGTMSAPSSPGGKAYPLDQGNSDTCTCYAIANAIADQLADKGIDIDQNFLAEWLVANNQTIGPVWPHFYENYAFPITVRNRNNGKWISLKIAVREVERFSDKDKHVLAYHTRYEKGIDDYHCVYVDTLLGNCYQCVNSWKDNSPYPEVELDRYGNRLWIVKADVESPRTGWYFADVIIYANVDVSCKTHLI